jgi:spermidine/putrescine transport system permease protein
MATEPAADLAAPRTRLALLLLMAPALVWLVGLIVLPHLELAVLSLRTRVAPRVYEISLNQYRTFIDEPLYWHTFVRTAAISILATVCTLLVAFPGLVHREDRARSDEVGAIRSLPDSVLGQRDRPHAGVDDPVARIRRGAAAPGRSWNHGGAGRDALSRRHDSRRPRLHVDAVHGRPARQCAGEPRRFAGRGSVRPRRQRLVDPGEIVVPHAAPGIVAGSIVVFMLTVGNYLTPTLLGGKNSLWFTAEIYTQFITRFNWEQGAAFGFLLLLLSTAIVWLGLKLSGQSFGDVMRRS